MLAADTPPSAPLLIAETYLALKVFGGSPGYALDGHYVAGGLVHRGGHGPEAACRKKRAEQMQTGEGGENPCTGFRTKSAYFCGSQGTWINRGCRGSVG